MLLIGSISEIGPNHVTSRVKLIFSQDSFYSKKTSSDMVRAQAKECTILGRLILGLGTNIIFAYKINIFMNVIILKHFRPFD